MAASQANSRELKKILADVFSCSEYLYFFGGVYFAASVQQIYEHAWGVNAWIRLVPKHVCKIGVSNSMGMKLADRAAREAL